LQLPAFDWLMRMSVMYYVCMSQISSLEEMYSPAFAAKFAGSTALAVLGTTGTPSRTTDEAGVSSTGTISSDFSGLPWRQSDCRGRLGSNKSGQKPEKRNNLHPQRRLYGSVGILVDESDGGSSLKV